MRGLGWWCGRIVRTGRRSDQKRQAGCKNAYVILHGGLTTATAFWSYAHSDDEGSGGQIRRLKEQVDHAFKRHSGEELRSFFDKDGSHRLEWGDEWRSKISTTISGTTFFIAVVSPSYLKSTNCRDEFTQFWEKAENSDLTELLLPILWVPVYPETELEQQIWTIGGQHQYVDWTFARKLDENSCEYKGLIDGMGERLADAARAVSAKPEVIPPEIEGLRGGGNTGGRSANRRKGNSSEDDLELGAPGVLDLLAEADNQTQLMIGHIVAAVETLGRMQREVSVDSLHRDASSGQRLFFLKRVAKEIAPFAAEFDTEAAQAEGQARLLNTSMFNLIDLLNEDEDIRETLSRADGFDKMSQLPALIHQIFGDVQYEKIKAQILAMGRMSRDLRVPMSAIERGFDALDAVGQTVTNWATALTEVWPS